MKQKVIGPVYIYHLYQAFSFLFLVGVIRCYSHNVINTSMSIFVLPVKQKRDKRIAFPMLSSSA